MEGTHVGSLINELETTLGTLSHLVDVLRSADTDEEAFEQARGMLEDLHQKSELHELPKLLFKTYSEVTAALGGIRLSREAIQLQAIDRLKVTSEKLSQVSSETETAAMRIMDGLDRSLGLIDRLEGHQKENDNELQETVESLRKEVFELFDHLQFQDIIAQQLNAAADMLSEVEGRLEAVAELFGSPQLEDALVEQDNDTTPSGTYDQEASMGEAEQRQTMADEMVKQALDNGGAASEASEISTAVGA